MRKDINKKMPNNGDIIKVWEFCFDEMKTWIAAIKTVGNEKVVYNPNCCEICRTSFGSICGVDEILGEFEIIGNMETNPELLTKK